MARVVSLPHPIQPQGIAHQPRTRIAFGRVTAVGAVLSLLSLVGSLVLRLFRRIDAAGVVWVQARIRREEDRKLWALAQTDPRLMADLVALQQHSDAHSL